MFRGVRAGLCCVVAAVALAVAAPAARAELIGDAGKGREIFSLCSGCHEVGDGAQDGIGPHLNGIFGREAGAHEDFPYSNAMERMGTDGLVWTLETLDAYIENPRALVSKTRMSFRGLEDAQERADLLAYLRTFSDNPANIPEAAPTAIETDHDLDPDILALEGDPEYGEYLATECLTCHKADGSAEGIPSITRWPEEDFVVAMHAYKNKLRPHPVMQMMAGRLSNEEIAALAAYFKDLDG
ncbi:c-type cytochrome [Roseovarius salis]|uniref:c-type cytochrome n=1 Tax=Roseovarius salis TaxID=3376063 RepID=UPI0037C53AB1